MHRWSIGHSRQKAGAALDRVPNYCRQRPRRTRRNIVSGAEDGNSRHAQSARDVHASRIVRQINRTGGCKIDVLSQRRLTRKIVNGQPCFPDLRRDFIAKRTLVTRTEDCCRLLQSNRGFGEPLGNPPLCRTICSSRADARDAGRGPAELLKNLPCPLAAASAAPCRRIAGQSGTASIRQAR